jgi:hypothetical protein
MATLTTGDQTSRWLIEHHTASMSVSSGINPSTRTRGMAIFVASISGTSAMLMHRWAEASEVEETTRAIHIKRGDPREEATKVAYQRTDGTLFIPGSSVARMLREAGGSHKQRGSRKSLKFVVPAAVLVLDEEISLIDDDGNPLRTFEVDSRPVVIPSTKGRIMRHRPRLNSWGADINIDIDLSMIESDTVHQLLEESGKRLGLGDYRPERGGPFGRFALVRWAELAGKKPTLRKVA